jgi:hypothetical protein
MITGIYHSHGLFTERDDARVFIWEKINGAEVIISIDDPITKEVTYFNKINCSSSFYQAINAGIFTCYWYPPGDYYYLAKFTSTPMHWRHIDTLIHKANSLCATDIVSVIPEMEYLEDTLTLIKELEIYKRVLGLK